MNKLITKISLAFLAFFVVIGGVAINPEPVSAQQNFVGGVPLVVPGVPVATGVASLISGAVSSVSTCGADITCYIRADLSRFLSSIAYGISYIILTGVHVVIAIESYLLRFVLGVNTQIINSPIVKIGFSITLAVANLLFVAGIIAMAIATIVRYEKYGFRKLLWKIVLAAIAVNFSLVLAGVVIRFSDETTLWLMRNSVPDIGNEITGDRLDDQTITVFTQTLVASFTPQQSLLTPELREDLGAGGVVGATAGSLLAPLYGIILSIIITLSTVIFLGALIAGFAMRYIALAMGLVLMPIAWLSWVFPFGSGYATKWLDRFIKWTFFPPITMFFMYISIQFAQAFAFWNNNPDSRAESFGTQPALTGNEGDFLTSFGAGLIGPLLNNAMAALLVGGTMYYGLGQAANAGVTVASKAQGLIKDMGKGVHRRVGRAGGRIGLGALRQADRARTAGSGKDARGRSYLNKIGDSLAIRSQKKGPLGSVLRGAGAVGVARQISKAGTVSKETREKRRKEYKEYYGAFGDNALKSIVQRSIKGSLVLNVDKEVGAVSALTERKGGIFGIDEDIESTPRMQQFMQRMNKGGMKKDMLTSNPFLAEYLPAEEKPDKSGNYTKEETIGLALKSMKPEDFAKVATNVLGPKKDGDPVNAKQAQTVVNAGTAQMKKAINENRLDIAEKYLSSLEYMLDEANAGVEEIFGEIEREKTPGVFSTGGAGLTRKQIIQKTAPVVKELRKNIHVSGALSKTLKIIDKKAKDENTETVEKIGEKTKENKDTKPKKENS